MTSLITSGVWARITKAAKAAPTKAHVAVAYFGKGASKLLPLRAGSTLVVDMSESAVKSGQTNPGELLKLINRGVAVYSVPNLHAKVFVIGPRAFIGSANASTNSANTLVEAVLESTDRSVVTSALRFVREQAVQRVLPEYARTMLKLYKPAKFGASGEGTPNHGLPATPVVHVVHLVYENWSEAETAFDERETQIAARLRKRPRQSVVDAFRWTGGCVIQKGDIVIQVTAEGRGRKLVSPPANVLRVRRYGKTGRPIRFVYVEVPTAQRRKALKVVRKRLPGRAARTMSRNSTVRRASQVRALLGAWQ